VRAPPMCRWPVGLGGEAGLDVHATSMTRDQVRADRVPIRRPRREMLGRALLSVTMPGYGISLTRPDDWHLHLRDGARLQAVLPHSAQRFARAIVMPNLRPPVTTTAQALAYQERILRALPEGMRFEPLMTLYLTDRMSPQEIQRAAACPHVHGVKLYPAGATTHSEFGVTQLEPVYPALEAMAERDLPLLVHGEVTDPQVDVFDREPRFIDTVLVPLMQRFPRLRVVFEHITTAQAVDFVRSGPATLGATITPQHLLYNRNALFQGGLRPHHYCLPVLKRERHRQALLEAATSGDPHSSWAPTARRIHAPTRRPPAAAPASIPPMPPSSCMPRPSSRWDDWIAWRPSPASMAPTFTACRATLIRSRCARKPGRCRRPTLLAKAMRWFPCGREKLSLGSCCETCTARMAWQF